MQWRNAKARRFETLDQNTVHTIYVIGALQTLCGMVQGWRIHNGASTWFSHIWTNIFNIQFLQKLKIHNWLYKHLFACVGISNQKNYTLEMFPFYKVYD